MEAWVHAGTQGTREPRALGVPRVRWGLRVSPEHWVNRGLKVVWAPRDKLGKLVSLERQGPWAEPDPLGRLVNLGPRDLGEPQG